MEEAIGFTEMYYRDNPNERPTKNKEVASLKSVEFHGEARTEMSKQIQQMLVTDITEFSPPDRAIFEMFYKELNFTNILTSKLHGTSLELKSSSYSITVNVRTIIEIFAQIIDAPISVPSELEINNPPPFIENIDEITSDRVSWVLCEFMKIFNMNDHRLLKLCHEYYLSMTYPIIVRLAYLDWERRQIGHKISAKTKEIKDAAEIKIQDARDEYNKLYELKSRELQTKTTIAQGERNNMKTALDSLNMHYNNLKIDNDNKRGTIEVLNEKIKSDEAISMEGKRQLEALRKENKELKLKIVTDEPSDNWIKDVTSSDEKPIYRNKVTKKSVIFEMSIDRFKKEHIYDRHENGICHYNPLKEGGKSFGMPEDLANMLTEPPKPNKPDGDKSMEEVFEEKEKMRLAYHFIKTEAESKREPTLSDVAKHIKMTTSNLRRAGHLPYMVSRAWIKEIIKGDVTRYTM